ncbi:MAG: DNA alkylation repair protein [Candidatus Cloacimonas sp.]|jgi:3-methyladenine DNA glycosylase AlkD|nr:DNA alkylation repair protein [Candidatus Cloacimonas sp.]
MTNAEKLLNALLEYKKEERIAGAAKFFKAGRGEYGEGDIYWGITVPQQRAIAKEYYKLISLTELEKLLKHEVHEVRLTTLFMLILQYQKSKDNSLKAAIVDVYKASLDYVNNWDLVDASAPYLLGDWLIGKSSQPLVDLANSNHLWRQRVAMIATYAYIRKGVYQPTLELAELLLTHKHDLIHKAVGWMLREMGNRSYQTEYDFLLRFYKQMPRTMLRYAIEKFHEPVRQQFLKGEI